MLISVRSDCLYETHQLEPKVDVELFALLKLQQLSAKLIAYLFMEGGVDKGREEENFAEKGSDAVFFIEYVYALLKDLIDELVIIELSNLNNMAYQF